MRKSQPQTTTEWLEDQQPEFEDAVGMLLRLIRRDAPMEEIKEVADYINEFLQDDDPRSMGWIGCDGLP